MFIRQINGENLKLVQLFWLQKTVKSVFFGLSKRSTYLFVRMFMVLHSCVLDTIMIQMYVHIIVLTNIMSRSYI